MQSLQNLKLENGTGIVEYGLIVALIAIVSLSSVAVLGHSTSEKFTAASGSLSHAENAGIETDSTTTTEAASPDTTTTLPAGTGGGSDDDDDEGGLGGSPTTTAAPATTTTTTSTPEVTTTTKPAPTTTTTTAPSFTTEVAEVDKGTSVIFGYVDEKVVVVETQTAKNWTVKVTKENKTRIVLKFTNEKTGKSVTTTGYVSKGELKVLNSKSHRRNSVAFLYGMTLSAAFCYTIGALSAILSLPPCC